MHGQHRKRKKERKKVRRKKTNFIHKIWSFRISSRILENVRLLESYFLLLDIYIHAFGVGWSYSIDLRLCRLKLLFVSESTPFEDDS